MMKALFSEGGRFLAGSMKGQKYQMEGVSYTVGTVTSPAMWTVVIIVEAWNNHAREYSQCLV
jgi:hypothetical protein